VAEFVCGVREKNPNYLSACKDLPEYRDRGYCVLHFLGEEKKEDFEQALVYSLGAVARLNPEPRPTEPGVFQFLVIVEGLLGPLQIALLALAVRRKVMQ
jgi:sorbitol-specific phosphotransferase system component IIC